MNEEIEAMKSCYETLKEFSFAAQKRVLEWLASRLDSDAKQKEEAKYLAHQNASKHIGGLIGAERK